MDKKVYFYFWLFIIPGFLYGQDEQNLQSGYTSLVIMFSGEYPKDKSLSTPVISNALTTLKPVDYQIVNDSTVFVSYYTIGPSYLYFYYDKEYFKPLLLPNHTDTLHMYYTDSEHYTKEYTGVFKNIFESSEEYKVMVEEALFTGSYFMELGAKSYRDANEFRDEVLKEKKRMIFELTKNIPSEKGQKQFKNHMKVIVKLFYLFNDYTSRAYNEMETDSGTVKIPLKKDLSFYEGLGITSHAKPEQLIHSPNDLYRKVRQDTLLGLPDILGTSPEIYLRALQAVFEGEMKGSNSLFYELMIAGAYMDHIDMGTPLPEAQKYDVLRFFKNPQISNYILHHNDRILNKETGHATEYYLPFEEEKESVLDDILVRYRDKVVVVDIWATWCGPCIDASSKIKEVKKRFSEEEVAFVYLAEESSDKRRWKELVDYIGGEHYYLYGHQRAYINRRFGVEFLPSYLIFNKRGELTEKSLGGYMGNEKLTTWIEEALKE